MLIFQGSRYNQRADNTVEGLLQVNEEQGTRLAKLGTEPLKSSDLMTAKDDRGPSPSSQLLCLEKLLVHVHLL